MPDIFEIAELAHFEVAVALDSDHEFLHEEEMRILTLESSRTYITPATTNCQLKSDSNARGRSFLRSSGDYMEI